MLMGMEMRIEDDRIIGTLNAPLVALTRHALERIYEREHVHTGGMAAEMREMTIALIRGIAAAAESGIVISREQPGDGNGDDQIPDEETTDGRPADAVHPFISDITLVPCKGGLMVVETVTVISIGDVSPVARLETRRSGTWTRGAPLLGDRVSEIMHRGHRVFISTVRLCRTYLSRDLLRPEQVEYRDLFLDAMTHVDGAGAALRMFGSDDQNRSARCDVHVEMPGADRMSDLLPRCVRPPANSGRTWVVY
jgi:hypothetical protein